MYFLASQDIHVCNECNFKNFTNVSYISTNIDFRMLVLLPWSVRIADKYQNFKAKFLKVVLWIVFTNSSDLLK